MQPQLLYLAIRLQQTTTEAYEPLYDTTCTLTHLMGGCTSTQRPSLPPLLHQVHCPSRLAPCSHTTGQDSSSSCGRLACLHHPTVCSTLGVQGQDKRELNHSRTQSVPATALLMNWWQPYWDKVTHAQGCLSVNSSLILSSIGSIQINCTWCAVEWPAANMCQQLPAWLGFPSAKFSAWIFTVWFLCLCVVLCCCRGARWCPHSTPAFLQLWARR